MCHRTFTTLVAGSAALAGEAVCMPVEWTDSNTAASSSWTFSVSYVHSGNGHWYFGIIVLCVPEGPLCFLLSSLSLFCPLLVVL